MSAPLRHRDDRGRRVTSSTSLIDIDELLFDSTGWFAIDAGNQRVPRVRVPSLQAGLALIGHGQVATVVGRLRPQVRVVDVDLAGETGHAVAELLARWAHDRAAWCLVRPSGGADGRSHVFLIPRVNHVDQDSQVGQDSQVDGLEEYVAQLRAAFKTSAAAIDLRRSGHVRPLSAPHRHGGCPRPAGDLRTAMRGLRSALQASRDVRPAGGGDIPATRPSAGRVVEALMPRPRPRRALPDPWERYLATGQPPEVGGTDRTRSTIEAIATAHLVRAGYDATTAWARITAAHPEAMVRARGARRRWTAWVWNRAVAEDHERAQHRPRVAAGPATRLGDGTADPVRAAAQASAVAAAVAAARAHLVDDVIWRLPVRQRRAVALVGHHVLDRIARTAHAGPSAGLSADAEAADAPAAPHAPQLRVPVPERDLVLDTGLRDRKTIRAALRFLDGHLGQLHRDAWDPTRRETSSFEFEIPPAREASPLTGGVGQIPHPVVTPPTPHRPPGPGPAYPARPTLCGAPSPLHPRVWQSLSSPALLPSSSTQTRSPPPANSDQLRLPSTSWPTRGWPPATPRGSGQLRTRSASTFTTRQPAPAPTANSKRPSAPSARPTAPRRAPRQLGPWLAPARSRPITRGPAPGGVASTPPTSVHAAPPGLTHSTPCPSSSRNGSRPD